MNFVLSEFSCCLWCEWTDLVLQESTIGAAFFSQTLAVNDATVKFEIWDTAGQERYHSLAPMYYRGAAAAIIVYDITNQVSGNLIFWFFMLFWCIIIISSKRQIIKAQLIQRVLCF